MAFPVVPPLPDPHVSEFDEGTMIPVWRDFWIKLLGCINSIRGAALTEPLTLNQPVIMNSTVTMSGTVPNVVVLTLVAYANDAAAAAAGVPLGGLYKNGGFVKIRVV